MDPPPAKTTPLAHDPIHFGVLTSVVFDDEPIGSLLGVTPPVSPTPTNAIERWKLRVDRSDACARAVASILGHSPEQLAEFNDFDEFEQCFRQALDDRSSQTDEQQAFYLAALGRFLKHQGRHNEAEALYWKALRIQATIPGFSRSAESLAGRSLVELLRNSDRKDEADQLRNRLKARDLMGRDDVSSLLNLRSLGLSLLLAGQLDEAKAAYHHLLKKRFELCSAYCHLARVDLMMGRIEEAALNVEKAWTTRGDAHRYVVARTIYLQVLLAVLAGRGFRRKLTQLRRVLDSGQAHHQWTFEPILESLNPRLNAVHHAFLVLLGQALCTSSGMAKLADAELWQRARTAKG